MLTDMREKRKESNFHLHRFEGINLKHEHLAPNELLSPERVPKESLRVDDFVSAYTFRILRRKKILSKL